MVDELMSLGEERKRYSIRQYVETAFSGALMVSWLLMGVFIGFIWVLEWVVRGMNHLGYTCAQKELLVMEVMHEVTAHQAHLLWGGAFALLFIYPFLIKMLDRWGGALDRIYLRADRVALIVLMACFMVSGYILMQCMGLL